MANMLNSYPLHPRTPGAPKAGSSPTADTVVILIIQRNFCCLSSNIYFELTKASLGLKKSHEFKLTEFILAIILFSGDPKLRQKLDFGIKLIRTGNVRVSSGFMNQNRGGI